MADHKPKDLFLIDGISHLCFNKDFTQCALSKKDSNVYIYEVKDIKNPEKWVLLHTLKNHFLYISGLDWCPATNRIVTCSYDKTAIIWEYANGKWSGSNLTASAKLGYLFAYWNVRGDKFVTGTSEKKLYIGYYNTKAEWWTGRNIKGHKSSVVCARIDPSSLFVISGSTDMKIMVTSCYDPLVDDQYLGDMDKSTIPAFETCIYQFDCGSWINTVRWNPSGTYCIASAQDANIYIINPVANTNEVISDCNSSVSMIIPKDDNSFYCVTYDREIYLYIKEGDNWKKSKNITGEDKPVEKKVVGNVSDKMKIFSGANTKRTSVVYNADKAANLHKSNICSLSIKDNNMITADYAGFVKYWSI